MRIPVLVNSDGVQEWAMIELQGKISPYDNDFGDKTFGPLNIDGESATLTIGNHYLKGKVHRLKKPLCVMRRGSESGIQIVSVIRKKVIFSDRPIILFPDIPI
ncbi:Kinetochore protein, putative [Trichomonas vaginalis G3]|uniref:Kinetochore protein, putative n=1 Tax=Trichomonas vaginalis (strain ATCC PRA-98 / G3) TaxID=412133 RepID=A2E731_TRIV3|nr:chromosome transmission fidelity factor 8 (CTF8) family protein family [Trichomonas vaginalis G3]EAY11549.1 Kinetochore protein, putative [Trichomonas vaginalis G3]KAI5489433.1 chromosome transmission fidelity factor 8 (CTF8) family protein family [Trichomonas vaginalis G3]|eukprot:XP_001323772.1 Kinetochore protein [Trichomonas vaginalis G3]